MDQIFTSNRLENLCQQLAKNISNSGNGVFGKEIIITQTAGMDAWLKTKLARDNGVFANFEFQNQDGFFSEIYKLLFKDRLQKNIDAAKYKIYDILGNSDFNNEFPDVISYFANNDLRRVQLAGRIADLFDQYQIYRPEMIENWGNGKLSTENSAEKWQRWVWTKLGTASKSEIRRQMLDCLESERDLIKKTYPEISFFGISVYTQFHLDFFSELAKYTNVNFYLCLPTCDTEFRNELLESFGTKAKELREMFGEPNLILEENHSGTLLARIQNHIATNSKEQIGMHDDDSIQVNSCYTPAREAECLYNYLLDLFEKDKELLPGDVLVMATDINKYAPFVRAVFKNAPVKIPIQVSGAANNSEDTIVSAFEQILSIREEDLTSEKVVGLLEQKRIGKRFGVQDTDYIRSVVGKTNIRFGRENRTEDDTRYVSWKYGLEKILLGYAMLTEEEYPDSEGITLYPYKDAEASASYDLFRLKAFVETLESVMDEKANLRTLADWKAFVSNEIIGKMIYWDDFKKDDRAELATINKALSFIPKVDLQNEVPFDLFLEELKSKLFTASSETRLNTGRVTISAPIPVRGIPYKVICFIGLDNGIFPRKDNFMGFDLLGEEYLAGDRNKMETDKYLFLDTLLSAREKLYLSYIGQSVKDNSEIPPSIVVDTLLDYLDSDIIATKHPLHGFSTQYQSDNNRLFTYLYGQETQDYITRAKEVKEISEVTVGSLIKFFQAPVDWYFNSILDIKYDDTENYLSETEIFELDYLQKWKINNDLLKLDEDKLEAYLDKGRKEGFLPLGSAAKVAVDMQKAEIDFVKPEYQKLKGNRLEENIVIDLNIEGIRITGTIDNVYEKDYAVFSASTNGKYKVEAYIKALLLYCEKRIDSARFMDKNGIITLIPANKEMAEASLKDLLQYFIEGNDKPLLFTLKAAEKAIAIEANKNAPPRARKEKTEEDELIGAFKEDAFPKEGSLYPANPYLQILFNEDRLENLAVEEIQKIQDLAAKLKINQF